MQYQEFLPKITSVPNGFVVQNQHPELLHHNGTYYSSNLFFEPRPYQWDGIRFLKKIKRGMCADPPGLGKTLQLMMAAADGDAILIVCPSYLTEHWWDQIRAQFPNDSVVLISGSKSDRAYALTHKAKWYIANYQMLRFNRQLKPHEVPRKVDLKFTFPEVDTIIFDESHHLRNRDSQMAKCALVLSHKVPRVYMATGTPIMREADDLFMQLHILDPDTFTSYWQFVNNYCIASHNGFGYQVHGQRGNMLKNIMEKYAIRRTYDEVGLYLPPVINNVRMVKFTPENLKKYRQVLYQFKCGELFIDNWMQQMHTLRICTGVTEKLNAVMNICEDLDKFLIFTWYKPHARFLASQLKATLIISDEVPPEDRKRIVAENDRIVCTLGSLSEGVDASHIRNVIFFEEHFTPGAMEQAVKRSQRWSADGEATQEPINAYYVMVKDTIDEAIHRTQTGRSVSIKQIVKQEYNRV